MTIRAFIAIDCPCEIQHSIQKIQRHFMPHKDAWRWVLPENIHLTLQFLGNISTDSVQALSKAMAFAVEGQEAFSLSIRGLGCFPHPYRPQVLWMGIDDPSLILPAIHRRLTQALSPLGFHLDFKYFRPHLTLARTRKRIDGTALQSILDMYQARRFGAIVVDQIHLYQSRLHHSGATHVILSSVDL